jgi:hypothetical protein
LRWGGVGWGEWEKERTGGLKAEDPHWGLIIYSEVRRQVGFTARVQRGTTIGLFSTVVRGSAEGELVCLQSGVTIYYSSRFLY